MSSVLPRPPALPTQTAANNTPAPQPPANTTLQLPPANTPPRRALPPLPVPPRQTSAWNKAAPTKRSNKSVFVSASRTAESFRQLRQLVSYLAGVYETVLKDQEVRKEEARALRAFTHLSELATTLTNAITQARAISATVKSPAMTKLINHPPKKLQKTCRDHLNPNDLVFRDQFGTVRGNLSQAKSEFRVQAALERLFSDLQVSTTWEMDGRLIRAFLEVHRCPETQGLCSVLECQLDLETQLEAAQAKQKEKAAEIKKAARTGARPLRDRTDTDFLEGMGKIAREEWRLKEALRTRHERLITYVYTALCNIDSQNSTLTNVQKAARAYDVRVSKDPHAIPTLLESAVRSDLDQWIVAAEHLCDNLVAAFEVFCTTLPTSGEPRRAATETAEVLRTVRANAQSRGVDVLEAELDAAQTAFQTALAICETADHEKLELDESASASVGAKALAKERAECAQEAVQATRERLVPIQKRYKDLGLVLSAAPESIDTACTVFAHLDVAALNALVEDIRVIFENRAGPLIEATRILIAHADFRNAVLSACVDKKRKAEHGPLDAEHGALLQITNLGNYLLRAKDIAASVSKEIDGDKQDTPSKTLQDWLGGHTAENNRLKSEPTLGDWKNLAKSPRSGRSPGRGKPSK